MPLIPISIIVIPTALTSIINSFPSGRDSPPKIDDSYPLVGGSVMLHPVPENLLAPTNITIHGKFNEQNLQLYNATLRHNKPFYVQDSNGILGPDGRYYSRSGISVPYEHRWINMEPMKLPPIESMRHFEQIITLTSFPDVLSESAIYALIMPNIVNMDQELKDNSLLITTKYIHGIDKILQHFGFDPKRIVYTQNSWVEATTMYAVQPPDYDIPSPSLVGIIRDKLIDEWHITDSKRVRYIELCNPKYACRDSVFDLLDNKYDPSRIDLPQDMIARLKDFLATRVLVSFNDDYLYLAAYMKPGSVLIIITDDEDFAIAAATGKKMGHIVHVISTELEKDHPGAVAEEIDKILQLPEVKALTN